jgi:hypothetical protein
VDEEDLDADGGQRQAQGPARMPEEEEEERQRRRDEYVPVERPRLAEERERAAVTGCKQHGRNRGQQNRDSQPDGAEQRQACLVEDGERHRGDRARLVQHDLGRRRSSDLRDQREERVPERKRIARMQSAIRKLVHRADVQIAEGVELLDATEVKKRVAADDPCDVPESNPETEPEQRDGQRVPGRRPGDDAKREGQRNDPDDSQHDEREQNRAVHEEHEQQRGTERGEPPDHGGRRASKPDRARDERSREEQNERCRDETEPEPDPLRGEQACDAKERQGQEQDGCAAKAATQRPHACSIRRRAHGDRAPGRPRRHAHEGACAR